MIFTRETTRLLMTLASGALLAACETTPAIQGANPDEIGQSLGYSRVIAVENVPDPATFTLEPVNASTVVMKPGSATFLTRPAPADRSTRKTPSLSTRKPTAESARSIFSRIRKPGFLEVIGCYNGLDVR